MVAAIATTTSAQTPPAFTVRGPSEIGEATPRDAVAADINHDGRLDLVVTTAGNPVGPGAPLPHRVNFLVNDGNGSFTRPNSILLANAAGVAVADLNGDGALDVAATSAGGAPQCAGAPATAIYLGAPNLAVGALFQAPCLTGVLNPIAVQAGDFDRDGRADLAVATGTSASSMRIYLGNGDGTFQPGQIVNSSSLNVQDMAPPVDVNHDGFLDLVVGASNTYRAFLGRGDGSFDAGAATVTGDNTLAIAVADVDGDGHQDLAAIEQVAGGGQLRVRRGIGNGAFQVGDVYPIGPGGVSDLAIGDLDDDGDMDIAVAAGSLLKARLFLNNGSGVFVIGTTMPSALGSDPYRAITGDFNGDTLGDVAMIGPRQGANAQVFVVLQQDQTAPTVDITTPADGSTVSGIVTISATAADNVGVTRVDFFANDVLIGTSSAGPNYSVSWDTSALAGSFTIRARAFDAAGNFADDSVSVTVADLAAPSAPANLTAKSLLNFHVVFLNWDAATDNVGVDHYRLYELVRKNSKTSVWELIDDRIDRTWAFALVNGRRGQTHTYAVTAVDAAGNESARAIVDVEKERGRDRDDRDDDDDDDGDDDDRGHGRR
jgi:hypothetical protein